MYRTSCNLVVCEECLTSIPPSFSTRIAPPLAVPAITVCLRCENKILTDIMARLKKAARGSV